MRFGDGGQEIRAGRTRRAEQHDRPAGGLRESESLEGRAALVHVDAVPQPLALGDGERKRGRARARADEGGGDAGHVQFTDQRASEAEVCFTDAVRVGPVVHHGAPHSSGPSTVRSFSSVSVNSAAGWDRATMPAPAHAVALLPRARAERKATANSPSPFDCR